MTDTTQSDLKAETIRLLTFWLPADETARRQHAAEAVDRLFDQGLKAMIGTACSLASGLHLLDSRIACWRGAT